MIHRDDYKGVMIARDEFNFLLIFWLSRKSFVIFLVESIFGTGTSPKYDPILKQT